MKASLIQVIFCSIVFGSIVFAQISPGDLFKGHQHLEGMDNCTNCHTVGRTLSNDRCLDCHKEIQSRVAQKKGFHQTVVSKQCVECHKDHHGREFSIIRFDKKTFNHSVVGFVLDGKHSKVECEKCHTVSKITAKDIQAFSNDRKTSTYLGLSTECSSCHKDEHKGQFKQKCAECHTTAQWKPANLFTHEKAEFKLVGAHTKVECAQCHKKTWDNGSVTRFIDIEFSSCQSCHSDPHKGKFKQECTQCHTTESWHEVKGSQFDHSKTAFPLKEKHLKLKCEQCHEKNPKVKNVSGEFGFHITRFNKCSNCHNDAHGRQFESRKDGGACESCHTEKGFIPSQYGIIQHAQSRFVLIGSHIATPCGKCHTEGKVQAKSTRIFHWKDTVECITCHANIHGTQFASKSTNGCETCHSNDSWQALKFSHDKTKFPLRGKHASIVCSECHKQKNNIVQYVGVGTKCVTCHEDRHGGQFAKNGKTDCERCHIDKNWKSLLFDHNTQASFSLTGKHANVACEKCHKPTMINQKKIITYKPLGAACIDCHPA